MEKKIDRERKQKQSISNVYVWLLTIIKKFIFR